MNISAAVFFLFLTRIIPVCSQVAGEVLQKFSTYGVRLAIIGDFTFFDSRSLQAFIPENNRTGRILFTGSEEEAGARLLKPL